KPAGWTSHDVVARVRTLLGVPKVGHTGTLDPAATGVLVVCLGKATRIAEYLMNADKAYRAVLRLGFATDTEDATGTMVGRVAETLRIKRLSWLSWTVSSAGTTRSRRCTPRSKCTA